MQRALVCTAVVALIVASTVIFVSNAPRASNAVFKVDYQLYGPGAALPGGGSSASGSNSLCLPYLRRTGLDDASDLAADIDAQAGASAVVSIARLRPADGGFDLYDLTAPTDFALATGEEYRVVVNQSVSYTILGSHDPGATIVLLGADDPGSVDGENAFCPPYHTPNDNAGQLRDELAAAAGNAGVVSSVGRFLRSNDTVESYTGGSALTNFPLATGEGYRVTVDETINVVPEHR